MFYFFRKPFYGGEHTVIRGDENLASSSEWNWRNGEIRGGDRIHKVQIRIFRGVP
jgi:hypothetical protein